MMERLLLWGLIVILLAAPLPFGSARETYSAVLVAACLSLGALWVVWRARRGLPALPLRDPVLWAGALFTLVGVLQLVPLPRPWLGTVSPTAVELRDRYEPQDPWDAGVAASTDWRPVSLYPWATRQSVLRFLAYLIAALVAIDLAGRTKSRRALILALVAGGCFQAIYGLAEYFSGRHHIFAYAKEYYRDVATGTFINRNHFAGYLEMTLPLLLGIIAVSLNRMRSAAPGSLAQKLARAPGRQLFVTGAQLVLALIMATALVCSRSRMGIVSAALSLLLVGLFLAWRGRGRSFALVAILLMGATLMIFSQGNAARPVVQRFQSLTQPRASGLGRGPIWAQTAGMVAEFPLSGVGLGAFQYVFPVFRTSGEGVAYAHAHSDYLELFAETGAVGCLVALLGAVLVLQNLLRGGGGRHEFGFIGYAALAAVISIAIHSLVDFNLAIPANALTFSILLGVVICWLRSPTPVLAPADGEHCKWVGRSWAPACTLLAMGLIAVAPVASATEGRHPRPAPGGIQGNALDPIERGGAGLLAWASSGNAERLFRAADEGGEAALRDLQILIQARAEGSEPSPLALGYILQRLSDALELQQEGLRRHPLSSS
ncbi:MAG: O-antigen ligase family protein, partial [Acidobacteriota bacterium]